jgi:hypothetical protein
MEDCIDLVSIHKLFEDHDKAFDCLCSLSTDDLNSIKKVISRRKGFLCKEVVEMSYLDGVVGTILRERGDYGTKLKERKEKEWIDSGRE